MALMRQIAGIRPIGPNRAHIGDVSSSQANLLESPFLWAAAGLGGAYLATRHGHINAGRVGKRRSLLVPALIVGGVAAIYLFTKQSGPAASSDPVASQRAALSAQYSGQGAAKQAQVIATASPADIQTWYNIMEIWAAGKDPYSFALDGTTATTNRAASIGIWWEQFSTKNGF